MKVDSIGVVLGDKGRKFEGLAKRVGELNIMLYQEMNTYEFLIELVAFGVSIGLEIVVLIFLLDLIKESLVLLRSLVLLNLWLHLFELCGLIEPGGSLGGLKHAKGGLHGKLVLIDAILHCDHLEIAAESKLANGVEVEIELVLIDLVKVLLNVVEILESKSEVALSQMAFAALNFVPHALHVVDVESVIALVLGEESHGVFGLLELVNSDHVP